MYSCKKCNFITDNNSLLANHYKYTHVDKDIDIKCEKCNKKIKTKGGLKIHLKSCKGPKVNNSKTCPKCNFLIKQNYEKHLNYCDGRGPRRSRTKVGCGWSKGLTKYTDERVLRQSLSIKNTEPHKHTDETKLLLSKMMIERYKSGWESTAGRCKKIEYISPIAGIIKVDGTWELKVSIYLDNIGVRWIRNTKRFKYNNTIKECISTYCPDFYVYDWDSYIEVKGYKTELDNIKWEQFKDKLEIWDKSKLLLLGIKI